MKTLGTQELFVIFLVLMFGLVGVIPFWRISKRLGYSGWLGLVYLLPCGALIWGFFVAFTKWPRADFGPQMNADERG